MKKKIRIWLIEQPWLWKKVVFNNGVVGSNYHRYDHRILPYSEGMGDRGIYGGISEAIKHCLDSLSRKK